MNIAQTEGEVHWDCTFVRAMSFHQEKHKLYLTAIRAEHLIQYTKVNRYDSSKNLDSQFQGYQRIPARSRITRVGNFILQREMEGLLPNPIILSSRTPIPWTEDDSSMLQLDLDCSTALMIIDGQTRVEGLRYAIEERNDKAVKDIQIPVVILDGVDKMTELQQFRIINGEAKPVRTDLVSSILSNLASKKGTESIPEKDRWKVIATMATNKLSKLQNSPWHKNILMPDQTKKEYPLRPITASSMISSIRPVHTWLSEVIFTGDMTAEIRGDYIARLLARYWSAIREINPTPFSHEPHLETTSKDFVIQKTPGVYSLHILLPSILRQIYRDPSLSATFTKKSLKNVLKDCPYLGNPDFWLRDIEKGGIAAQFGSQKGFQELSKMFEVKVEKEVQE